MLVHLLIPLLIVAGTVTDTVVGTVTGTVACTVTVTFSRTITDTVTAILINIKVKPRNFGNLIPISCKIAVLCCLWFSLITALYTARLFVSKHNAVELDAAILKSG